MTPSVDGGPGAMREHNFASISNTSIHEAYPGHHLQLTAALERPTLSRLLVDAPEFVEGWGMYSELLLREHGFDATPAHQVALATWLGGDHRSQAKPLHGQGHGLHMAVRPRA